MVTLRGSPRYHCLNTYVLIAMDKIAGALTGDDNTAMVITDIN